MKILVLGGNGFIGSNFCESFAENAEMYSFDISIPEQQKDGIHYICGDYFDADTLEQSIKDKDVVIHAISLLNPSNSNERYRVGYEKEMQQMMLLCELMSANGQKLIFLSSGGTVYGNCKNEPIHEEYATNPINHYGGVKVCMETMIRTFVKQGGLKAHIARISNPYGPGQDYKKGVGFIDAVVRNALYGNAIEIWGDGENVRDYIYISDVCNMLWKLCDYDGTEEVFNISTGKGVSQNQIIAYVGHELGALTVKYLPGRIVDLKRTVLSNEKICGIYKGELISIQNGIKKYIDYMKECIESSDEREN